MNRKKIFHDFYNPSMLTCLMFTADPRTMVKVLMPPSFVIPETTEVSISTKESSVVVGKKDITRLEKSIRNNLLFYSKFSQVLCTLITSALKPTILYDQAHLELPNYEIPDQIMIFMREFNRSIIY